MRKTGLLYDDAAQKAAVRRREGTGGGDGG